jgi:hypothetical protein
MRIKAERVKAVAGIWKFRTSVSTDRLVQIAFGWRERDLEKQYGPILIRGCGTNQRGIQFEYRLRENETFEQFTDEHTDRFKRLFGNEFVGWDVSNDVTVIR